MKAKAFRLSEAHIETLKKVAQERGCTETDLIRQCIDSLSRNNNSETPDDTQIHTLLVDQLKVKDEQIAALTRALEAAQETARTAQALEVKTRDMLAIRPAKATLEKQMTALQRLRAALRG